MKSGDFSPRGLEFLNGDSPTPENGEWVEIEMGRASLTPPHPVSILKVNIFGLFSPIVFIFFTCTTQVYEILNLWDIIIFSFIASIFWHMLNLLVFYGHISPNFHLILWAVNVVESMDCHVGQVLAQLPCPPLIIDETSRQLAPPQGSLKLNSDAASLNGSWDQSHCSRFKW